MSKSRTKNHERVRRLAVMGMLSAVSIIMGVTPLGFLPIPGVALTLMHIPVIIGTLLEGLAMGSGLGLLFGGLSFYRSFSTGNFIFQNPLVSVLPRLLIAPATFGVFVLASRLFPNRKKLAWGLSAAAGSLGNTIFTLSAMFIAQPTMFIADGQGAAIALKAIGALVVTNGIPECIVAVVLSIALMSALSRVKKK